MFLVLISFTNPFRFVIFNDFFRDLLFLLSRVSSTLFRLLSSSLSSFDFFVLSNIRYELSRKNDDFFRIVLDLFYKKIYFN